MLSGFETSVLRSLEVIKLRLRDTDEALHSVLSHLNSDRFPNSDGGMNNHVSLDLGIPFGDLETFIKFDSNSLKDANFRAALVSLIFKLVKTE